MRGPRTLEHLEPSHNVPVRGPLPLQCETGQPNAAPLSHPRVSHRASRVAHPRYSTVTDFARLRG